MYQKKIIESLLLKLPHVLAIVVGCLILYLLSWCKRSRKMKGPPSVSVLANIPSLEAYPEKIFAKWAKTYGAVYSIKVGRHYTIVLNGYEAIHQAFVKQGSQFTGRYQTLLTRMSASGNNGILFLDDEQKWKIQRQFGSRALSGAALQGKSLVERVLDEAQLLCKDIQSIQGQPIILVSLLTESLSNVIDQMTVKQRCNEEGGEDLRSYVQLITRSSRQDTIMYYLLTIAPWLRFVPPIWQRFQRMLAGVEFGNNLFNKFIEQHEAKLDPKYPTDFVDLYLVEKQRARPSFQVKQLCVYLRDLVFAGTETSSSVLGWIFLHLIRQPKIQEKIHEEIDRVIGREGEIGLHADLPYTKAVIQEGLRIETVVPLGVPRKTCQDVTLMGYFIPKNTQILANIWSVHNDPELWPDPRRFDPGRHLDEDGKFVKSDKVIPFSVGPRNCLGENLARIEIFLFLVCILQKFHILPNTFNSVPEVVGRPGPVYSPPTYAFIVKER